MLCEHAQPGTEPFETLFVIEDYLGLASGIVACRTCDTRYLLELIDLAGPRRAYRLAEVEGAHADAMIRTLTRGTCDINRARSEVQNLESRSRLEPEVLAMEGQRVVQRVSGAVIPTEHWRELPCDGRFLALAG